MVSGNDDDENSKFKWAQETSRRRTDVGTTQENFLEMLVRYLHFACYCKYVHIGQ